MALDAAPPPSPPPPPPPPPPPSPPPPPRSIPLHSVQLHDQGEGAIVEVGEKAAALWSGRSESPRSPPYGKLPGSGYRHEGACSSRHMEPPLGPSAGSPEREEPAVQQGGSPQLHLCEAHNLFQDAATASAGVIAGEPPAMTSLGQEKKMQEEHTKWLHRRRSATPSSSSSSEEALTPKKARKKLKPEPVTVKMEPLHEEPPLPFPMVWGATSRRRSPIHAENPEVTISESIATARDVIVIDDDSDNDGENAVNIAGSGGGDGNTNPAAATVNGFGAARLAPDAVQVMPVARARAPAAAIEIIVIDDDSSDDDNGNNAAAVVPLPMPRAPVPPMADDTWKGKNAIHEAGARYSNGDRGKAVAVHNNACHGKAGAGSSSGGSGKAIAIGGQSTRGSGKTYSCANCVETFDTPQALGGHANLHRSREKSMAMLGFQSAALTAVRSGRCVFPTGQAVRSGRRVLPTGQALGWHRKSVIGSASNASSSSAPRPAVAEEPSGATAMMNRNAAAAHGPANAGRARSFPAPAGSNAVLALLALSPVAQRMAMAGNSVTGFVPAAASAATGSWPLPAATSSVVPAIPLQNQGSWSLPAATSSVVPTIPLQNQGSWPLPAATSSVVPATPLQNQGVNSPVENAAVPGNRRGRPLRIFGRDHFPALSSQNQEENPPQEAAAALGGNGEQGSIRLFGSVVSPAIPPQNQEENPPQEIVPGNPEPAIPPQNQEENPPQEIVPGNPEPRIIRLFGVDMAEGPNEPNN
ncbi:unnamed protein product [Urochloa humidicola]